MKTRYRLIRRGVRNGVFYCVDTQTGKRASLQTGDEDEVAQLSLYLKLLQDETPGSTRQYFLDFEQQALLPTLTRIEWFQTMFVIRQRQICAMKT